jgi:hypothetical protein
MKGFALYSTWDLHYDDFHQRNLLIGDRPVLLWSISKLLANRDRKLYHSDEIADADT